MSETSRAHKVEAPKSLNFGVFICSTSRFKELEKGKETSDASGDLIVSLLKKTGHVVVSREILPDNPALIAEATQRALHSADTDVAIFCGGTGITPSDVTIEAVSPYLQKHLAGFGEIFRRLTYDDIGSAAVLSRACAGIAEGKAVFCIPGSPNAVRTCFEKLILPEVGHIVKHARERSKQGSDSRKK
jgi:molybdenum cofactor biosynthesis protein B